MPADVLTGRAVNRALLARQYLLARAPASALHLVRHLCGLQAQAPFPPYYGLLARLEDFRPADRAGLLESRAVVRIALMRSTIHLVTADDALVWRPLIQPVLDPGLAGNWGKQLAGLDLDRVAARGRELTSAQPLTFAELGAALAETFPGYPGDAQAMAVRCRVPLVQVPPRAVWGKSGLAKHTPAGVCLDRPETEPADRAAALTAMIERYLAAFGPATVQDVQTWSGLTRLREIVEPLRDRLRVFTDERGRELFDLPGSPRPDPDVPAPPRLVAEFDNLILSHHDRTPIMAEDDRRLLSRS